MRYGFRAILGLGILVLLLASVVTCSPAPAPTDSQAQKPREAARPAAPAPAPPQAPNADGARSAFGTGQTASESTGGAALPWDRMIIRTGQLRLTVENVEESLAAARRIANQLGGFVAQSETRYDGDRMIATLTLQVPVAQFDTVVQELRRLAVKVESESSSSQDVTEEYVDLQAQVTNLEATEARLRSVLEKATRLEDILTLQREITQVRGQIERIQGRMNYLQRRTTFSSIAVTLAPPVAKPKGGEEVWNPLETAERAWQASLRVIRGVVDALIVVVVFFWWLAPLAVLTWPLWRLLLSRQRRTPAAP
ncbi:MAG: DUF4349 domain-containing protein [Chloroflexi bacterium]|nr:DUF4349 domain-containing protein [Chloroflexota bacterium]